MFDEFVEHAGTPSDSRKPVPQLENQGFEPDDPTLDIVHEPDSVLTSLETGYFSNAPYGIDTTVDPLFVLGRVQVDIPGSLVAFTVASDQLFMATSDLLIHINLRSPEKVTKIPLFNFLNPKQNTGRQQNSKQPQGGQINSVYKLHLDPSGKHLILATASPDTNLYLYTKWPTLTPRPIKSFKMVIESVAWNRSFLLSPSSDNSTGTREILIGGRGGVVYEAVLDSKEDFFKGHDRSVTAIFTLPERQPIAGLAFQWFGGDRGNAGRGLVVATTATRIYQFVGTAPEKREEGRMFTGLFAGYKGAELKFLELPGSSHSELHAQYSQDGMMTSVAWLTGQGIYHGLVNYGTTTSSDALIDSAQLLPYPPPSHVISPTMSPNLNVNASTSYATSPNVSTSPSTRRAEISDGGRSMGGLPEVPISIGVTKFHFLSLFGERLVAVSSLDSRLDFEESIPLKPGERILGLASDPVNQTYWVYTDASLFELNITKEARDVWQIYMRRGEFEEALQCTLTAPQRDLVIAAQGDSYISQSLYAKAAERYAQTSRSFEQVALTLVDSGDRDALQYYLVVRLGRTKKADLTQRMMLATWLVEFYLSKYNDLDDLIASESAAHDVEDLKAERRILDKDLKTFFENYQARPANLDRQTVYELILSHGRTDVFLHYATIIGDYQRVVEHWILEEEWEKAIDVLNRQSDLELYYRYAPTLLVHAPTSTVDSLIRQPLLDPLRLIPALLQLQHAPRDPMTPNQSIRYLDHIIFNAHNISPTIHNLIITLYASPAFGDDDRPFLRFLSTVPKDIISGKPYYDLDYALRICKENKRIGPCVTLYAEMGLWENSVDLALEKGDLELAKINADKAEEEDVRLRKKLWLKIAKYVVQDKKDIKSAMAFIKDTSLLKIEDILPFFPDFVIIDDFKDEICLALEEYTKDIDKLRSDMDEATRSAETIKKDIANLKNRFVTLEQGERCAHCNYPLFTRQFYVFPCQHSFHADCLIGMVKEYLPAHALRKILLLQAELVQSAAAAATAAAGNPTSGAGTPAPAQPPVPKSQRTLLSSQFNQQATNGRPTSIITNPMGGLIANPMGGLLAVGMAPVALGRNMFVAADRLKDMIVPDALANAIALPSLPWAGGAGGEKKGRLKGAEADEEKGEKVRETLDELLASSCPLCESVVAGLDKPFIDPEEEDTWQL